MLSPSILQTGLPERTHESFANLKVGDRIWNFDTNRRVYRHHDGRKSNAPIYREHFQECIIAGETKASWLVSSWPNSPIEYATKVNKKTLLSATGKGNGFGCGWYTDATREVVLWLHDHHAKIAKVLEECKDIQKLEQIAAILNYQPVTTEE